jgi:hypothetical protein
MNVQMPLAIWVKAMHFRRGRKERKDDRTNKEMTLNKTYHPELGCSGGLNLTVTVHLVNVGTLCLGRMTGLAAVDERHKGRESRSSLRYGKHTTWRRTLASLKFWRK